MLSNHILAWEIPQSSPFPTPEVRQGMRHVLRSLVAHEGQGLSPAVLTKVPKIHHRTWAQSQTMKEGLNFHVDV